MKLHKIAALGLVVALAGACETDKKKPEAEGATNNTTSATNAGTAEQGAAAQPDTKSASGLPIEATGPIAKIDGEEISADEFNTEVKRLVKMMGAQVPPAMLVNMKGQIVEQLVAKKLVEKAVASSGVKIEPKEVDSEYGKFVKQLDDAAPGGAKGYLEKIGRTEAEMKDDVRRSLELKALISKDHDIEVPAAEVKKFYEENKAQFEQQERLQASHILLKLDKTAAPDKVAEVKKKADDIAKQAKAADADFAALAKAHSEGPTAPRGGDLGYFERGKMVPEFDKAVWAMKKGEVSEPVRTQFGFHIIKAGDKREAKTLGFAEAKDMIEAKLQEPKLKTAMKATIDKLKESAKVEKMEQNIKTNVAAPAPPPNMFGGGGHPPITAPPPKPKGGGEGETPKLKLDKLK